MSANRRPQAPRGPGRGSSRPGGQSAASRRGAAASSASSASSEDAREKTKPVATSEKSATGRPAADAEKSRWAVLLPEVITVRTLVLSVVLLLAVVLLLPTIRAYVNQTGDLRDLRSELANAQEQRQELEVELARWGDTSYVVQQARNRLNYVMPGDTSWRVLDPETVIDDTNSATGEQLTDGPVRDFVPGTPWYESVWESVQLAGERGDGAASDPGAKSPVPAPSPSTAPPTDGSTLAPSTTESAPAGDNG